MNNVIRDFFSVINIKTLIVIVAACLTTVICVELGFHFNVPTDLISIAIVFPIVFSLNAAYSRREKALEHYSVFKGSALSVRFAHMHWIDENSKENRKGKKINGDEHVNRIDKIYKELFSNLYDYLHSAKPNPKTYDNIIKLLTDVSLSNEKIRPFLIDTENSRLQNNLRFMAIGLEKIINIKNYRTPNSLRAYTKVFLNVFPIIFGPFFAHIAINKGMEFGIAIAIIYSLVLTILDNIQEDLEDPFDGIGSDDIRLNFPSMLGPSTIDE